MKFLLFIFISGCIGNNWFLKNSDSNQKNEGIVYNDSFFNLESKKLIKEDNASKLEELFEKGLRINRKYGKKSLLFRAVKNDKEKCINLLLSKGAIVSEEFDKSDLENKRVVVINNAWEKLPFLKEIDGKEILLKRLREEQKKILKEIFTEVTLIDGQDEELYLLNGIQAGANINEIFENKISVKGKIPSRNVFYESTLIEIPLISLSYKGTPKVLDEFLRRYERDINEVDSEGRTALSYSIESGNIIFAKRLVEAGADPNIHKSLILESSPLIFLVYNWRHHEDIEFLEILIQKTSKKDILEQFLKMLESSKLRQLRDNCKKLKKILKNPTKEHEKNLGKIKEKMVKIENIWLFLKNRIKEVDAKNNII